MKLSAVLGLFLTALVVSNIEDGSAIRIEIDTDKYDGIVPTSVNISCVIPKAIRSCATEILAIQVSKNDGRPLATVRQNSEVSINHRLLRANIKAEGHIGTGTNPEESKLAVRFRNVLKEDSGLYSCTVIYLDELGFLQQESAMKNFTAGHHEMHDIVRYLSGKLSAMEKHMTEQDNLLQTHEEQLLEQDNLLQAQRKKLLAQETHIQRLDNRTETEEASFISGFSAGYVDNTISKGNTLVFSQEIIDIGNDYDARRGVFTAPRDGLFIFHLFLSTDHSKGTIHVDLKASGKVVATLQVLDKDDLSQSSVSTFVVLEAGDEVMPVVRDVSGSYSDNNVHSWDHYSAFTLTLDSQVTC